MTNYNQIFCLIYLLFTQDTILKLSYLFTFYFGQFENLIVICPFSLLFFKSSFLLICFLLIHLPFNFLSHSSFLLPIYHSLLLLILLNSCFKTPFTLDFFHPFIFFLLEKFSPSSIPYSTLLSTNSIYPIVLRVFIDFQISNKISAPFPSFSPSFFLFIFLCWRISLGFASVRRDRPA